MCTPCHRPTVWEMEIQSRSVNGWMMCGWMITVFNILYKGWTVRHWFCEEHICKTFHFSMLCLNHKSYRWLPTIREDIFYTFPENLKNTLFYNNTHTKTEKSSRHEGIKLVMKTHKLVCDWERFTCCEAKHSAQSFSCETEWNVCKCHSIHVLSWLICNLQCYDT